jgi:hypothetical protein
MSQNQTVITPEFQLAQIRRYILILDVACEILHSNGLQGIPTELNHLSEHLLQTINDQTQPE